MFISQSFTSRLFLRIFAMSIGDFFAYFESLETLTAKSPNSVFLGVSTLKFISYSSPKFNSFFSMACLILCSTLSFISFFNI